MVQEFYSGTCPLLEKLGQYEALEIGFDTMKSKESLLRSVCIMLSSGLVPEVYVLAAYHMMIGCLQIKFTPAHDTAMDVLAQIFKLNPDKYFRIHLNLIIQVSFLVQIPEKETNDALETSLMESVNLRTIESNDKDQLVFENLYKNDCEATQEYLMLKDFHYNLCKSMFTVMDLILQSKALSQCLFDQYRCFFEQEYLVLNQGRSTKSTGALANDFQQQMIQANLVDTDEFRQKRKVCYSKLCISLELFNQASHLSRLPAAQSEELIEHLLLLLTTADSKLQKTVLQCLIKCSKKQDFKNKTLLLPKYQKLLEGLTDDAKFKDMIPVINHGSEEGIEAGKAQTVEDDVETGQGIDTKKKLKGAIPKLEKEDRLDVLPVIVKLLFSKLMKKKGMINKKNIHTRRNIVYAFLSGLDPATEFPIFFKELLEPLGLSDIIEHNRSIDSEQISVRLSKISFGQQLGFINSLDVIFKQLGSLLSCNDYLTKLAQILILILSLAKKFSGNLKESDEEEQSDQLYKFVGKQSKMCARKGLKILRDLFNRFSHYPQFMKVLSQTFYDQLVKDELPYLKERYCSEKSQLIEIITIGWSSHNNCLINYTTYPKVLPNVLRMLEAKKLDLSVVQQIMQMIKNLVVTSLDQKDKKKQQLLQKMQIDSSDDENQVMIDEAKSVKDKDDSKRVIQENMTVISQNLHKYWQSNQQQLKQAVSMKQPKKQLSQFSQQIREQTQLQQTLSDMTFILSELSQHIGPEQLSEAQSFIEMLISMLGNKQLLETASTNLISSGIVTTRQSRSEELLLFGFQALSTLIGKVQAAGVSIEQKILENVFLMLLYMESRKARQSLTEKLLISLSDQSTFKQEYLEIIRDMCALKKGMADVPLDYEKVLKAIKKITELDLSTDRKIKQSEVNALTYVVVHLLKNDEFSVRDYAQHAFSHLLQALDAKVFRQCEIQIINYIKQNNDELVLKTILEGFKSMIVQAQSKDLQTCMSYHLEPLLFQNQSEDFFSQILSMQMQHRSKALRKLQGLDNIPATPFRQAILPLVDYLIFNTKSHMQNKRNTIRYTREQSGQLLEDALNVYVSYAKRLKWTECFKLIRKLLFKIEKVTRKAAEVSAQKEDINMEKIVTKCLCKVLDGLSQNTLIQLPDSVDIIAERAKQAALANKKPVNEFSKLIETMLAEKKEKEIEEKKEVEESDEDSSEDEELEKRQENPDVEMTDANQVKDIQQKLVKKVLPLLQRHLQETQQKKEQKEASLPIRGFVAQSIAKVIRKLPIHSFKIHLHKLINAIIVKGLRSTDLATREKARKALLKVIGEVSPRFLELIINQMHDNLTRGYQLHVYLYTVHYILNHLTGQNTGSASPGEKITHTLEPGMITSSMIRTISDLLLRELFGDLYEERMLQETKKKHIKESKARKAYPIFEVFTQYIDFTGSFLDLIAPVIKILEENPNFTRIQQCEDLLGKISSSLLKNPTLTGEQLLIFIYSIIERGIGMSLKTKINDEKTERDYGAKADDKFLHKTKEQLKSESHGIQMKWITAGQQISNKKTQEVCGRVLASFGLQCLKKGLKQKGLILSGEEHEQRKSLTIEVKQELKDRLDPFVKLLLRSFKTFYNPIVVTTLHILIHVIHLGLPSFKTLLKKFLNKILSLFSQASQTDTDFLNSLFKCVAELVRTYSVYNDLSEIQVKTLVLMIKSNVANYSAQSSVFYCLKAIIHRKFLCADLYDLMETIEEMMVSNVQRATRQACAGIFIQFILEYPLEAKRLEQHINHLLKNLTYFDIDGRMQLLDVFETLIERFPQQLLDNYNELFFFALFLRLVNDDIAKCRDKIQVILRKLVAKVSQPKKLIETVFMMGQQDDMTSNKKESLLAGKLKMIQIFAEAGKLSPSEIKRTVQFTAQILERHSRIAQKLAKEQKDIEISDDELKVNPKNEQFLKAIDLGDSSEEEILAEEQVEQDNEEKWSKPYTALSCIDNLFQKCDKGAVIQAIQSQKGLCSDIIQLSWRHLNFWVRLTCQRVFGHIFSYLHSNKQAGVSLSNVMQIDFGTDDNTLQKYIYQMLGVLNFPFVNEELTNQLVKNLVFLQRIQIETCIREERKADISKTYKKASYIGRKIMGEKTESTGYKLHAIVQFYTVSVKLFEAECEGKVDNELIRICIGPILELIYRTYTDEQVPADVRSLSTELVDTLGHTLEKSFFIDQFSQAQKGIVKARQERKMKEKLFIGTAEGQEKMAKKRILKTFKKREKHREKVLQYAITKD